MSDESRQIWALAVLTLVVIDPAMAASYPGSLGVASGGVTDAIAQLHPTAVVVGRAIMLAMAYGLWRLMSFVPGRDAIPALLSIAGVGIVIVRFASIGGVI